VINKADAADPMVLARLRQREPHSVVCSARTGDGIAAVLEAIEADLPVGAVELRVLLPYSRGDLVSRLHDKAEVLGVEHTAEGTLVHARVSEALAGELELYTTQVS
jgi:GTP-binding protein HflX